MKDLHEHVKQLGDLVEKFECIDIDIESTKDFFTILSSEFEKNDITPDRAMSTYRRMQVLQNIFFDRIVRESKELDKIFYELFKLHSALSEDIKQKDGE